MYEIECLTEKETFDNVNLDMCSPFSGECYPVAVGCCGPDAKF